MTIVSADSYALLHTHTHTHPHPPPPPHTQKSDCTYGTNLTKSTLGFRGQIRTEA